MCQLCRAATFPSMRCGGSGRRGMYSHHLLQLRNGMQPRETALCGSPKTWRLGPARPRMSCPLGPASSTTAEAGSEGQEGFQDGGVSAGKPSPPPRQCLPPSPQSQTLRPLPGADPRRGLQEADGVGADGDGCFSMLLS